MTPEDLTEAWHIAVAAGDEPIKWMMREDMWAQVQRAASERALIDAGDPLPIEGDRTLLGTPIEIQHGNADVAFLHVRREGQEFGIIIGANGDSLTAAQVNAHSTFRGSL